MHNCPPVTALITVPDALTNQQIHDYSLKEQGMGRVLMTGPGLELLSCPSGGKDQTT